MHLCCCSALQLGAVASRAEVLVVAEEAAEVAVAPGVVEVIVVGSAAEGVECKMEPHPMLSCFPRAASLFGLCE